MRRRAFLRTSEHEEAVRSLEWAELQARGLETDPYLWKWVIIALHNATQGFMVLALWNGNGLLTLRPHVAEKWLKAYENGGPFPAEKLDDFLKLYAKVKDGNNFHTGGAGPFKPTSTADGSLELLNELRNEFTHFTPKGWSLELAGLPRMCLDALVLVEFLGWQSTAVTWYRRVNQVRAKRALRCLRKTLITVQAAINA